MARLQPIYRPPCDTPLCVEPAGFRLFNEFGVNLGSYCRRCGQMALARQTVAERAKHGEVSE